MSAPRKFWARVPGGRVAHRITLAGTYTYRFACGDVWFQHHAKRAPRSLPRCKRCVAAAAKAAR